MEPTKLDFTDHGMVISAEDASNTQLYLRAKKIAADAGQTLHIAPPVPKPWQPEPDTYVVPAGVSAEEFRQAHAIADKQGLTVVVAPAEWTGPAMRTADGDAWAPPPNTIVISRHINEADFMRANETATRLGCKLEIAPESANVPDKLPEKITPGLPISIPRGASHSEYKRLKKLAEDRGVAYHIAA
jgi:hypothetical protein